MANPVPYLCNLGFEIMQVTFHFLGQKKSLPFLMSSGVNSRERAFLS